MAHYAKVRGSLVTKVLVAEEDFITSYTDNEPGMWIQTSYNTHGGVHVLGGTPLRKNFAGVGYTYDSVLDAFIPPRPFDSWELNQDTCLWEAPVAMPNDGNPYLWKEDTQEWVAIPLSV